MKHRNLPLLMLQAREHVIARFRPILNAHGLTEQQWRIIRCLLAQEPMEPRELVQVCQISSPSLTGVLARMDEAGWVRRERMDNDQRRVQVWLTAQSRDLAQGMAPEIEAVYQGIEAQLGAALTAQLYDVLDQVLLRLGESSTVESPLTAGEGEG